MMPKNKRALLPPICFVGFIGLITVVMNFSWTKYPVDLKAGDIATRDIRADRDYDIIDQEANEKLKQEKLAGILPVFDWDSRVSFGMKVVDSKELLASWMQKGILIRSLKNPAEEPAFFKDRGRFYTVEEAQQRVRPSLRSLVRPNLVLNQEETEGRKNQVLLQIKDVVIKVQRGESIVRSGDRIEPWHVKVIEGIRDERTRSQRWSRWIGTFGFALLFLGLLYGVGRVILRKSKIPWQDFIFQGTLLLLLLTLQRLLLYFSGGIRELLPFEVPLSAFTLAMPLTAGAMIVRIILSGEMAFLFSLALSCLASLFLENGIVYGLYFLVGGMAVIWLSHQVRSRATLLKVGLQVGVVNLLSLLVLSLISPSVGGPFPLQDLPLLLTFALVGGLFSAVTVLILLPVFESVFNYLTPIKLLEFGSLNHPLLREMIVRAPGTYHHSHMVGTLAEAASEAIGADGLFARVACYFHDIGKLAKPPYFIENQSAAGGEDRHSNLSPSMSALIIASHVKEGIELARQYKLPPRIVAIIPEHQGTKLITYFYSKAKEAEDPNLHVVNEKDYRYPGPKPQTREAGIILLADTVEAATRALKDRSPARLEEVVRNMINKNFIDGQLDECELTLKDLEIIGRSFIRILMGIYHQRVAYPEMASKEAPLSALHVDKYTQPTPLSESSFREDKAVPPKNIPRIGR